MPSPAEALTLTDRPRTALPAPWWLAALLMVASGGAGLAYQIVWTQQATVWLGHDNAAVLAVLAAFFGGLGVGAALLGSRIERARWPARWYALCEAVIGLWALLLALLMAPAAELMLALTGAQPGAAWQWTVAFVGSFVLLLPATAAMGATLPAMERTIAAWQRGREALPALYAANTFGAVLGVLAAAFWWLPSLGLTRTAALCALLNLGCALLTWRAFGQQPCAAVPNAGVSWPGAEQRPRLALLAATGLLGIGYEVVVVRVLSQVAENTVYTFALLLAVYLAGSAAGAALYARRAAASVAVDDSTWRTRLLWLQAAACLAGALALWRADALKQAVLAWLGPGFVSALAGEALVAAATFVLPTLVMGALFAHLSASARAAGIAWGRSLAVNTFGAALAPLLFGVLLLPAAGAKWALLAIVAAYALLALRRGAAVLPVAAVLGATAVVAALAPALRFVDVPAGGRIISLHEGAVASVSVVEDAYGSAVLRINNRQQEGSSATVLADARQALLPLLLHPVPQRALFLGLGSGVTAQVAALDARLQVDVVELLPEVVAASAHFAPLLGTTARLNVMTADARRYVRASTQRYDLVVSDNFHPARSGSAALYTVEHFAAVRERLAARGVFCQWLPLHQLDLPTLKSIVRSFVEVYPGAFLLLASNSLETPVLGLVARGDGGRLDLAALRTRAATVALQRPAAEFGLHDEWALFGSVLAGPSALRRFAADAALNRDDHPVVAHLAPRLTYTTDSLPRDRLLALLPQLQIDPAELFEPGTDATFMRRLSAYHSARNQFLRAGRDVMPSADVQRMLAQVQEPLLQVLATSPDFRPAYDPLLRMAAALVGSGDITGARALLERLRQLQPARPEAAALLQQLPGRAAD